MIYIHVAHTTAQQFCGKELLVTMAELPAIDMAYNCDVYEPAEDTFLLLDALQDELPYLVALDPALCVEIGCVWRYVVCFHRWLQKFVFSDKQCRCGSGAVFVYLATQLQQSKTSAMFLATDINRLAASVAQQTATNNGVHTFNVVRTDLLQCFEARIQVRSIGGHRLWVCCAHNGYIGLVCIRLQRVK